MKQNPLSDIITRTCLDEMFRKEFVRNPVDVLRREGIEVPEGVIVKVVENADDCLHIVLPAPSGEEPESWEWKELPKEREAIQPLDFSMHWESGALCLAGRINSETAQLLRKELDKVHKTLAIDFSQVSFMGSAGLAVLFATQRRLSKDDQKLFLCDVSKPIKTLFQIAGMDTLFKFVEKNVKDLWWMAFPSF
jgi:anti-sigma B factor antagonist